MQRVYDAGNACIVPELHFPLAVFVHQKLQIKQRRFLNDKFKRILLQAYPSIQECYAPGPYGYAKNINTISLEGFR